MKTTLICFALVLAISAIPRENELYGYTFEKYVQDFEKVHVVEELEMRKQIFEKNLATILKHNSEEHSWKMGVNKFADMTEEEKSMYLGHTKGSKVGYSPLSDLLKPEPMRFLENVEVAASVDWRTKGAISPVKDQGGCGSCWAFGTTETVESAVFINDGSLPILAPQQLVDCAPNPKSCGGTGGCEGSIPQLGIDYLVSAGGQKLESDYPYTARDGTCQDSGAKAATVTGYSQPTSNDEDSFIAALNKQPLVIAVAANDWFLFSSGVFSGCSYSSNIDIDHAVQAVGYGTDSSSGKNYYIVRNSWGSSWGESGYIRLEREATLTCGKDSTPLDGIRCKGYDKVDTVCGQCGILFDAVAAEGAHAV